MHPRAPLFAALRSIALSALALGACAGSDAPAPSSTEAIVTHEPGDEPGSTRATREAARAGEPPAAPAIAAPSSPVLPAAPSTRPLLTITAIDAREGEDGTGATIAATRPLALDLDARRVPPRALDPVLHVGSLRFTRYAHPRPGVMRFVVADRALLPEGAEVFVQYGEETSTRLVLTPALELPAEVRP